MRLILERKYKADLPKGLSAKELNNFFRGCKWTPDPWGQLLDYISKPEKFYITKKGDCDDWACFAANVICYPAFILTVNWYNPGGEKFIDRFAGHNVCLFFVGLRWWHAGNWGIRGPFESLKMVIKDIIPDGSIPVLAAVRTPSLKIREVIKLKGDI